MLNIELQNGWQLPSFLIRNILFVVILTAAAIPSALGSDIAQSGEDEFRKLLKQGDRHVKRGEMPEAEKSFRRILSIDPKHAGARLKLAFVYLKQRRLNEAYDLSFAAAKEDPKNARAFAILGATLLGAGRFDDARKILVTSLRLDRDEALAWAGFGMLDFYENRILDSLANLREAVYHEPNDPDYVFSFAQVSARAERYNDSAAAYNRFLNLSRNTDDERRARIKGLINFLRFLGQKEKLYTIAGQTETLVPFEMTGNRPVIQLNVNGRDDKLNFVLDTGSGISVISDKTAERLGIEPITRGGFAKGIGGDGRFEIVYGFLRTVEIGDVKIKNVPVYIRKFHSGTNEVDGYIGLSLISKFLTTIDYGAKTFSLTQADQTASAALEDMGISLPLRLTSSGFLSGEVKLEGVSEPLNFIVDTGASVSVISDDVAGMSAVSPFESGEKMRVVGAAGITDDVPSFLLPRVSFGSHTRTSVAAIALNLDIINEASGFEQAGILGGNFLKNYRMIFDFRKSQVTFIPLSRDP